MTTGRVLLVVVALVGSFGVAAALAASAAVSWGNAIEVPGTAALNVGRAAAVSSISCSSSANCTAGGWYNDASAGIDNGNLGSQAFVVDETSGVWGSAVEVPGTATLNVGKDASVGSVSCAGAGNCAAGGSYTDGDGSFHAFVVDEEAGVWGSALKVQGAGGFSEVYSVSCASAGDCAAGGWFFGSSKQRAFAVSEKGGVWGKAVEVPGAAALNKGGNAWVSSVSCYSAGNCVAGGTYGDSSHHQQAFLASEKNGVWGKAVEVPGTAALNTSGNAGVNSVSCASAGNCVAGGNYKRSAHVQAFVASEKNGVWGKAIEVPHTATLNTGGNASVTSVSCRSTGNCSAGGSYRDGSKHQQAFVASEKNGVWGKAVELPGTAALNTGGNAGVNSVSCATAGNCVAGGYYKSSAHFQALVASETNGVWGKAIEVPGTAALNTGSLASVYSVSCPATGQCGLGGLYSNSGQQAFVTSP